MLKAAKQITNEEYASCADFMRGVSGLDQLRTDPTTALSGGATGAEREALLAHVRQAQVRATAMLDEKRVQLKKLMMDVELLRDDDTEHYEERLALVHDVLLGAPTTVAQVVRHFGAASSSRLLQIEAMVAKLFRALGFPPPAICFQRDIPTILIAMQFSVRATDANTYPKEPAGCAETEGVQACSEEADHVKALLRELFWGGAYVQPMPTFQDGVRAIGGTEDRMLCRESALLKQALGSLGGCDLQWEQSKHELEVMLRGAQGASALRRLCVGDELSAEASADICGVVRPLKARLVGFFKAMRAGGPQLPTAFNLYDLSDNIYARDACLLCAALTDRIDDACDVDRFCELVRRISATTVMAK